MLLRQIILHSLQQIDGERTVNSIYYLLTGKQSIQTIQDAHLFTLDRYFSLYKPLQMDAFQSELLPLIEEEYIEPTGNNTYSVTEQGQYILDDAALNKYHWNGLLYNVIDDLFMQRLFLTIQVWTNRQAGINRYIPIVDHVQVTNWVKSFYYEQGTPVTIHLQQLYKELTELFRPLDEFYPRLFIRQLTTHRTIGLTLEQLATEYNCSRTSIYLLQKNYIHYLLTKLKNKEHQYPLLYRFVHDFFEQEKNNQLTASAQTTARLVKQGLSPEQIATHRALRITTIYDHLVEIALHDDTFSIEPYISLGKQQEVREAVQRVNSFTLKDIKAIVGEDISYFQIRLALTRIGKQTLNGVVR